MVYQYVPLIHICYTYGFSSMQITITTPINPSCHPWLLTLPIMGHFCPPLTRLGHSLHRWCPGVYAY